MKVAAVVATYNRKKILRKNLQALLSQSRPLDEIIVIDGNSRDGTDLMMKFEFPQVTYVRLNENMGASGHFHEGIKLAYRKGYDWIWVMDDDVVPNKNTLELLLHEAIREKKAVIVPKMVDDLQKPYSGKPGLLFAGGLFSRSSIKAVGLPLKEFFIYWDDIEYLWRLNKIHITVLQSEQALVQHTDWSNQPKKVKKILWIKVQMPIYPDWKAYYLMRNIILLHIIHKKILSALLIAIGGTMIEIFAYLLTGQYAKVPYIVRGAVDGILLRKGKRTIPPY
jgi:GT2 family glycosyltransferase